MKTIKHNFLKIFCIWKRQIWIERLDLGLFLGSSPPPPVRVKSIQQDDSHCRHPIHTEAAKVQPLSSLLCWPLLQHACRRGAAITAGNWLNLRLLSLLCHWTSTWQQRMTQSVPSWYTLLSICQHPPTSILIPIDWQNSVFLNHLGHR
jgi:hypothetical protein